MSESWAFPETTDLEPLFAQIQDQDRIPSGILEVLNSCAQDQKFPIACSGGADSTFLTFLHSDNYPLLQARFFLCNFKHRLRGID